MNTAVSLGLSVLMVIALVNLLKRTPLNMPSSWATFAAVVVAIVLGLADFAFGATGWYVALVGALRVGLGAAGLYDVTKTPELIKSETINLASVSKK